GVADTQLPKTFQQAVAVTRQLQIQYIWINSLCIFQDDLDDWSIQAATMQDV
ncbi:heterokaryon incompatibility, partial [Lizonia empirigonia]